MKIERVIWIVLIVAVAIVAFNFKSKKNTVTKYLPGDTIFTSVNIPIPEPYDTIIYDIDTIILPGAIDTIKITDTVFIYKDYFKMYAYKVDTTIDEMQISSNIKITQNRLYKYNISAKNNRKTEVLMPRVNSFGVGMIAGVDLIAPTISYSFKNHEIGVGYNLQNSSPIISYQYKFSFRKNE
jgi:hypothetical protein